MFPHPWHHGDDIGARDADEKEKRQGVAVGGLGGPTFEGQGVVDGVVGEAIDSALKGFNLHEVGGSGLPSV